MNVNPYNQPPGLIN